MVGRGMTWIITWRLLVIAFVLLASGALVQVLGGAINADLDWIGEILALCGVFVAFIIGLGWLWTWVLS